MGHTTADAPDGDSDLGSAAELLQYPPNVWFWNPRQSLWPKAPSDDEYLRALAALTSYNDRLSDGDTQFDAGAENLHGDAARISDDLGASSATIELQYRPDFTRRRADERNLLQNERADIRVLHRAQRHADRFCGRHPRATSRRPHRPRMMTSLRAAIGMRPAMILDGAPDSDFVPCTLCGEGFYVLRVRSELQTIANALHK